MEGCSLLLRSSFSNANNSFYSSLKATEITTNLLFKTPQTTLITRKGGLTPRRCSSTPTASDLASVVLQTSKWQLATNILSKHRLKNNENL